MEKYYLPFLDSENDVLWMNENNSLWKHLVDKLEIVSCEYQLCVIQYYYEWISEKSDELYDLSHIIVKNKQPIGLWTLNLRQVGSEWTLGSNYHEVISPVFFRDVSVRTKKAVIKSSLRILQGIANLYNIKRINLLCETTNLGIGLWQKTWMAFGASFSSVNYMMYADLRLDYSSLWGKLRDRYKTYINRGNDLWLVEIVDDYDKDKFDLYMNYHHKIAGRVTRGEETWLAQRRALQNQEAFMLFLKDKKSLDLVGASYFFCSKDESLYLSGAYDRSRFSLPVSHILQYKAIIYSKDRNIKQYRIGELLYKQNNNDATAKELSISSFKEGFATNMYAQFVLTYEYNNGETRTQE